MIRNINRMKNEKLGVISRLSIGKVYNPRNSPKTFDSTVTESSVYYILVPNFEQIMKMKGFRLKLKIHC